jgi:flagellar motor protein MotB
MELKHIKELFKQNSYEQKLQNQKEILKSLNENFLSTIQLKLSQKRAEAVKNVLINKFGIDPNRIIAKGYGKSYPLVPNTTDTNRALNRRVEIVNITNKN